MIVDPATGMRCPTASEQLAASCDNNAVRCEYNVPCPGGSDQGTQMCCPNIIGLMVCMRARSADVGRFVYNRVIGVMEISGDLSCMVYLY